ncbi:MAG: galactosyltransferase-related protein [Lapillicoccus sp.]
MTDSCIAVVTLAHGRHEHLAAQMEAAGRSTLLPDLFVVAAMDDPELRSVVDRVGATTPAARHTRVVSVPGGASGLPLARARNMAAAAAVGDGADVLVFLDVDCLPSSQLVGRYAEAVASSDGPGARPRVFAGTVHYLPARPAGQERYSPGDLLASTAHPARPMPGLDEIRVAENLMMFWSLSFAMSTGDWSAVGGFDEDYEGYGGEDTDYAMRLSAHGGRLYWVGGAACYHQHHEVEDPPVRHVADIVNNSNRFRARWGYFPMEGWLSEFAARGLIRRTGSPPTWHLTEAGRNTARTG